MVIGKEGPPGPAGEPGTNGIPGESSVPYYDKKSGYGTDEYGKSQNTDGAGIIQARRLERDYDDMS